MISVVCGNYFFFSFGINFIGGPKINTVLLVIYRKLRPKCTLIKLLFRHIFFNKKKLDTKKNVEKIGKKHIFVTNCRTK